jgi:cell wall-associated NlpC family hydrolase
VALTFDQFFEGIAQQESGGNYGAVNSLTGALGKYQILPSNVPAWSQKYLGLNWTASQFLNDPRKQDALAKAVLRSYYDKYGVRGAASAWYSGNPALANNYGSQHGGPSIGDYVDQVIAKATRSNSYVAGTTVNGVPTTVIDKTVKPETKPEAANASGMGAVHAPGAEAVTAPGVESVQAPGTEAVSVEPPTEALQSPLTASEGTEGTETQPLNSVSFGGRHAAIVAGEKWIGVPYVYGGGGVAGPSRSALAHGNYSQVGFDCSGLVQYVLAQAGIRAPRLSYDQLKMGHRAPINSLVPGDLVGFGDGGHVAVYLGDGLILEAPHTGSSVKARMLGKDEDAWGVSLASLY